MGTISINSTSMFYFAVASIFILCTLLKNQSLEVSSNSKITFNFSVFLMVQAVLVGIFALLDFFKEKQSFPIRWALILSMPQLVSSLDMCLLPHLLSCLSC